MDMTPKEKAQAYDEVINCLKSIVYNSKKQGHIIVRIEDIENNIPELKDNENERISKDLMEWFEEFPDKIWRGHYKKDILDWLEKQNSNIDNANKEYWRGYREGKQEILDKYAELEKQGRKESNKIPIWKHWKDGICGNGEGLPIYLIRDGNTYSLSSCLGFECDYIELSDLDKLMLETLAEVESDDDIEAEEKDIRKAFNKIWEEKQSEQKHVWSEEDKNILNGITSYLCTHDACELDGFDEWYDWLKSLKDRNLWKPSEEQIVVLELASKYERVFTPKQIDILIGLKEQLKKLKA